MEYRSILFKNMDRMSTMFRYFKYMSTLFLGMFMNEYS